MTNSTTITFEGDHIKALSRAHKSLEWATEFWTTVVDACEENDCYDVLGISESVTVMPFYDGFSFIELFRGLGIDEKYRIAWVELNPEAEETVRFVDTALFNRGLPGRAFPTEHDAKRWLLDQQGANQPSRSR